MASQKSSKGLPGSASSKSRKARYDAYRNEERHWHNKIARLTKLYERAKRRVRGALVAELRSVRDSVIDRSPIHVRMKYK